MKTRDGAAALPDADATIEGRRGRRLDRRHGAGARATTECAGAAAHDGVRLLRRQPGRRRRTGRRPSAGAAAACPAAAVVEDPCAGRGARHRRARARHRVRRQRPAGHDARRRRAHVRAALRRAAGLARRRVHQQRQRVRGCARPAPVRRRDRRDRRRASRRGARWRAADARPRRGTADHRRHPRSSPRTAACASRASTSRRLPAAPRSASRAISCACPAASIRPCISSRRRAARCATTMRWRRSSPARRRCPSFPRARPMAYSASPPRLTEGHAAGANAAARAGRSASLLAHATRRGSGHRPPSCRCGPCPRAANPRSALSICKTTSRSTTSRSRHARVTRPSST